MQNAQRLIKPMRIANPYAKHLTFTSGRTRTRRDHEKYLTLIDTIALLHQHQRKPIIHTLGDKQIEMLPVTLDDIEAANTLAPEVLGRSLDELPPQTRRLLDYIKKLIREKMEIKGERQEVLSFSRRELRDQTGWSEFQVRMHLERLDSMEYVAKRSGKQGSLYKYELLADAKEETKAYHIGLIDTEKLRKKEAAKKKE